MQCTIVVLWNCCYPYCLICSGGSSSGPLLPTDPLLTAQGAPLTSVPDLPQLARGPSLVVSESIPPIPTRLVEKIKRWEFIDLAQLIGVANSNEGSSSMVEGHIVTQNKSPTRCYNRSGHLATSLCRLMVTLLSAPSTS